MNKVLGAILNEYIHKIEELTEKLKEEASGRKVAFIQGQLSGCEGALALLREEFEVFETLDTWEPEHVFDIKDDDIASMMIEEDALSEDERWGSVTDEMAEILQIKKDYLFFEATGTRDLDLVHGYLSGFSITEAVKGSFRNEDKRRLEAEPLFVKKELEQI